MLNTATHGRIIISTCLTNAVTHEPEQPLVPLSLLERAQLPAHTFWTANTVMEPITDAALEYCHLKLGLNSEK